jgi:hypothetical protein
MAKSGSILGNPVIRREDPGILVGATEYLDDLDVGGLRKSRCRWFAHRRARDR